MAEPRLYDERKVQPIDVYVGKRIRMRRAFLGVSQEKLAEHIGVTFQQVQKYERGVNRISTSRLHKIAEILNVKFDYFTKGYESPDAKPTGLAEGKQSFAAREDQLYAKETLDLVKIYYQVEDEGKRRKLLKTIRSMVESMSED